MAEIPFTPSADVSMALHALLDILERRTSSDGTRDTQQRVIKVTLASLALPAYFSQTDPTPRLIANEQFSLLEKKGLLQLAWIPGETGHLLQSIALPKTEDGTRHVEIFRLLSRTPTADNRTRLESLLLADKFRFQDDWCARAISHILRQLKAEKSPAPFSLTDPVLTLDLLAVLQALPALTVETPFRVFSVRVFNDSKRFEAIKSHTVSLARLGNPEWKRISAEEVLRELNLVPNPTYIHLAGDWQLTTRHGEILNLSGFVPSMGFPSAQTSLLRSACAASVLCIENLTTFHQRVGQYTGEPADHRQQAVLCIHGNASPAIRQLLRLLPDTTPIQLWADMDYGGFNILAQLRKQIGPRIQPYRMDIATFDAYARFSRPLTSSDRRNLQRLSHHPHLKDVSSTIEYLLVRGLKLEQEAIQPAPS
jgi:hypothetical protein